ncbi:MAG TPA: carboxypeptidase-like regulatory domain-containing protein [Rubrivivax sp.]
MSHFTMDSSSRLRSLALALSASLLTLIAACGGGGSDAGTPPFGDGGDGSAQATALILDLSKTTLANTGSDSIIVTVTALAKSNTVPGAVVTVSADSDAIVTTPTSTTGEDGKLQSTLTIGPNRANRVITVTATSGGVKQTATVQVFGAKVVSTLEPAVVEPGQPGNVRYRVTDQAGNPMVDQDVSIVASGLTPAEASGKTGANGDFVFAYTAPSATGSYDVVASAGGTADSQTLQVQSASTVPPVTATITSASVSSNPSVVGTNLAGASSNRSEIRALFLGANNLPIKNVRVRFDLDGDVNSIGGSFTTGSSTLYSDVNGVATTSYVPAARSSPTNGVTVRACYGTSDTDPNLTNCLTSSKVTLTVTDEPVDISIGTNELIIVNELTYVKKFIVTVVDAAGNAKPDVGLVVSVDLLQYRKGFYTLVGDSWAKAGQLTSGDTAVCANEDTNRNGVLETGEDTNGNARLDPGKADVSISLLQTKTRADGTAELQLQYAKSFATWVDAKITVAASGVSGTEGRETTLVAPIPADAASIKNKDVAPAYIVSPYGRATTCANAN